MTSEEFNNITELLGFQFWKNLKNAEFLECESGWYQLIADLCKDLKKAGFKGSVGQIKEKFGGLRFYVDYYYETLTEEIYEKCRYLISEYEYKSFSICEYCGERGTKSSIGRGWIKTMCAKCDKEQNER